MAIGCSTISEVQTKQEKTMKKVLIGRHSLKGKDEHKELISDDGALRMYQQGRRFMGQAFHQVFCTSLIRTMQSALLFLAGAAHAEVPQFETVTGLGNTEEFKPLCPPEVMEMYKGGLSFWQAMETHFGFAYLEEYAVSAGQTLGEIFAKTKDGETSLVVAHDPFVSFAVWNATGELPEVCKDLKEGTLFLLVEEGGVISIASIYPPE